MVTEKEAEIDGLQKELTVRDETIQCQGGEIQTQATEIEGLKVDIAMKKEEIERCNQEKTNQQIMINELQAKLPSIDLMQVNETLLMISCLLIYVAILYIGHIGHILLTLYPTLSFIEKSIKYHISGII